MLCFKAIQSSFVPNNSDLFPRKKFPTRKKLNLVHCNSNSSDSETQPEGDKQKQELLAQIAMLQAEKLRAIDFLDERSAFLTQFAEEANAEIDQIGENALRELDEAGSRIMENIESQMQAFEESAELSKLEIDENEKKLADFEGIIEKERNEGLFFKNLTQKPKAPSSQEAVATAKEEMGKIKELTKESAGSKTRRNIYLALIGLVVIGISDALITSSDLRKVAILGAILVGLITQLLYEQGMLSGIGKTEHKNTDVDKE